MAMPTKARYVYDPLLGVYPSIPCPPKQCSHGFIQNSPKLGRAHMSANSRVTKYILRYYYNRILHLMKKNKLLKYKNNNKYIKKRKKKVKRTSY